MPQPYTILNCRRIQSLTLAVICWGLLSGVVMAAVEDGVTIGRQALQGQKYPWYDTAGDEPRLLQVRPYQPTDDRYRKSGWESLPTTPVTPTTPKNTTFWPPLMSFSFLNVLGISTLLLAIGAVIYLLIRAVMRDDDEMLLIDAPTSTEGKPQPTLRYSELPVAVPTTTGDFLAEVRRHYAAGQYNQAIIYLYSYLLLQLDRHEVIRLTKGKTNRQYLRETHPRPELRSLLEPTMIAFEDVFFGHHELERQQFEECYTKVDDFHRLLGSTTP